MKIIGIDTGEKGAIVQIDCKHKTAVCMRLPYKTDGLLNVDVVHKYYTLSAADFICVERVTPDPKFGAKSAWTFSGYYHMALMMVGDYQYFTAHPKTWQKEIHGDLRKDKCYTAKQRSLHIFNAMYPNQTVVKHKDDGIIDAIHIARFCGIHHGIEVPTELKFYLIDKSF